MALVAVLVVEFIQPCLVRFIYLSSANRVHSRCLSEYADSFKYTLALEVLGLKSRLSPNCVPFWRGNIRDRKKYQEGERMTVKGGGQLGRQKGGEGEKER